MVRLVIDSMRGPSIDPRRARSVSRALHHQRELVGADPEAVVGGELGGATDRRVADLHRAVADDRAEVGLVGDPAPLEHRVDAADLGGVVIGSVKPAEPQPG